MELEYTTKCPNSSVEAKKLYRALHKHDIYPVLEYWDGHKHVDMYIGKAQLFIEVDGPQHKNNYNQINADLERDYWSRKQNYKTLRYTNQEVNDELDRVVSEIVAETKSQK